MTTIRKSFLLSVAMIAATLAVAPSPARAQSDEIQVYDAAITEKGKFNLMIHSNFIASGRKVADFPGGIIADRSVNGTAEWAYGVTDWFEQGLYLPVYTIYSKGRGGSINGFKIRELFVLPHADDHKFFYGVNFEFSVNYNYWESRTITSEIRPIVGLHLHPVDIVFNPIMDTDYTGGFKDLDFVPSTRIAYNVNDKWAAAVEEYAGVGPFRHFLPGKEQFHEVWAVMNHSSKIVDIETGVGFGVTPGADKLTFKLMLSRDLN
jgi:opacity protein-like surface antigen